MNKNFIFIKIKSLIIIAPEKVLLKKIKNALNLIKKTDIKEYEKIFSRLNAIFITNKNGNENEFFMPEKIWFLNKGVVNKNDLNWLASLIIHEAFHATQFKNGKYILPLEELEEPTLKIQENFLKKLKDPAAEIDIKRALEEKYWIGGKEDKRNYVYFRNLLALFEIKKINLKNIKV